MRLRRGVATGLVALGFGAWFMRRSSRFRPISWLLYRSGGLPEETRAQVHKRLVKAMYAIVNVVLRRSDLAFLNYGYAPTDGDPLQLTPESEPDRFGIQLYDTVAGAAVLEGLDVLEVGCGRGGGTAFVFERHRPASLTGL